MGTGEVARETRETREIREKGGGEGEEFNLELRESGTERMGTEEVARETREIREKRRAEAENFYLELRESGTEGKQGTGSGGKRLPAKHAKYANGEEREGGDLYGTQGIRNGGVPEAVSRPTALVFVIFRAFWWPSFCGTQVYSELRKSGTEREGTGRERGGKRLPAKNANRRETQSGPASFSPAVSQGGCGIFAAIREMPCG